MNVKFDSDKASSYKVSLKVLDRDPLNQELQGSVDIQIDQVLTKKQWINGWHKLMKNDKERGEIYVQVGFKGEGEKNRVKVPNVKK